MLRIIKQKIRLILNKLIVNSNSSNFYNYITKLLNECKSFIFNVAFINFSGLQLLLETLEKLERKGVRGKILTSTYLNFTEVKALERILDFKNIELKIYDSNSLKQGFHPKAYIFDLNDEFISIIGSSNITSSAFKSNVEWNSLYRNYKDDYYNRLKDEFNLLWQKARFVDRYFLDKYNSYKQNMKVEKGFLFEELKPNYMQEQAIEKIEFFRKKEEKRVLAIAATGTGKTYLSVFDIKRAKPKRVLFIVHRENILLKAKESFEKIIKDKSTGIFTGNRKDINSDFIFATVQSLVKNYNYFEKDIFDYIVVDEAHHITSKSYKIVLNYFKKFFLLGLTATPNRMDNSNIYDYFDDNIACDIRVDEALEYGLIVPFHYYGVSDINAVDYDMVDSNSISEVSKLLMINRRVDLIVEKMNFYGFSGEKRKILAFCISVEHCRYMEKEFNKRGIKSISLTSEDTIIKREEYIAKLESDKNTLEVIFCVDIFNEGIDIPAINMILMLRPTDSSIVFAQQLGRGLRKHKDKEFLTLIDFIGNHSKTFLITKALLGDKQIDKESLKLAINNDFASLRNVHISIDEISKKRILNQIDNQNFNSMSFLKEEYFKFKESIRLSLPMLSDYLNYDEFIDPLKFVSYSKSYFEFLLKVEKEKSLESVSFDIDFLKAIRFIDYLLPIKRVYEFVILKELLHKDYLTIKNLNELLSKYQKVVNSDIMFHSINFLEQNYFDSAQKKRYLKLIFFKENRIYKTKKFNDILKDDLKKKFIEESIHYGIVKYEKEFSLEYYGIPFFKLYQRYNMLNIAQLCNFNKIHSSFRGSGFLKYKNDFFLFITIEKDKYTKASKYKNDFLDKELFLYTSKPSHSDDKGDGLKLTQNKKNGVNLHIFVRKFAQVDKKTQDFIYLGLADTYRFEGSKPINLELKLRNKLTDNLYEEFTKVV